MLQRRCPCPTAAGTLVTCCAQQALVWLAAAGHFFPYCGRVLLSLVMYELMQAGPEEVPQGASNAGEGYAVGRQVKNCSAAYCLMMCCRRGSSSLQCVFCRALDVDALGRAKRCARMARFVAAGSLRSCRRLSRQSGSWSFQLEHVCQRAAARLCGLPLLRLIGSWVGVSFRCWAQSQRVCGCCCKLCACWPCNVHCLGCIQRARHTCQLHQFSKQARPNLNPGRRRQQSSTAHTAWLFHSNKKPATRKTSSLAGVGLGPRVQSLCSRKAFPALTAAPFKDLHHGESSGACSRPMHTDRALHLGPAAAATALLLLAHAPSPPCAGRAAGN
jgi:hypothetical protein